MNCQEKCLHDNACTVMCCNSRRAFATRRMDECARASDSVGATLRGAPILWLVGHITREVTVMPCSVCGGYENYEYVVRVAF